MSYFRLFIYRFFHWEYWPMQALYYPLFPVWLFFAIRARSLFFFNAANPSIAYGGMAMESKMEIYDIIPSQYIPKTIFIGTGTSKDQLLVKVANSGIHFPFIAKPDIGLRGLGVELLKNQGELESYSEKYRSDFIVQELIEYTNEAGIFYVRHPNEKKGRITGIVSKEFLSVLGDGKSTLLELIKQEPRSYFQLPTLQKKYGEGLNEVIEKDKSQVLVPYGSHSRGAKFIDSSDQINDNLLKTIDDICVQIPGFYFGRLDILHSSFEELSEGKNFSIIEINGAGSEPTHIYDPKHSYFFALKEITRHWAWLYKISAVNKNKGHNYLSFKDGRAMVKASGKLEEELKLM